MKFTERLAASEMADRVDAKQLCTLLDVFDGMRCTPPGEREIADITGLTRYRLRQLIDSLCTCGVISVESGVGRSKNKYKKPKEQKDLESRRLEFRNKCWQKLRCLYRWDVIDHFTTVWSECDEASGMMRFEMQPTFEIGMRIKRHQINGVVVKAAETEEEKAEVIKINKARVIAWSKMKKE